MCSTLLIVGAGGHGRVIADSATQMACWGEVQFLDDSAPTGRLPGTEWDVVGNLDSALNDDKKINQRIIVGIGDNTLRLKIQDRLENTGWKIATVVHPSAIVSNGAVVEPGSVVTANAVVNIGARIGRASIINTHSSIDHDCVLGTGVHVSPGATLAGRVTVGDLCWIGAGATVIHGIMVGENTIIGAGAVVIRNMPSNITCVGNPARELLNR